MNCAGCDDCPDLHWHLHATVSALDHPMFATSVSAQREVVRLLGYKDVFVTNVMLDASYDELIPTLHFQGSEAKAVLELCKMYEKLCGAGFTVARLKIEGDPRIVGPRRALYYEAHIKIDAKMSLHWRSRGWAISVGKGTLATVRSQNMSQVLDATREMLLTNTEYRVEACVLDTAPEIDAAWLAGARAPELR